MGIWIGGGGGGGGGGEGKLNLVSNSSYKRVIFRDGGSEKRLGVLSPVPCRPRVFWP